MAFPFNDPFWSDCVRYLHTHGGGGDAVVAPSEFAEALPNRVVSYPEVTEDIDVSWVIIHKGMLLAFDPLVVEQIVERYTPVYANEVFVIFSKGSSLAEYDKKSPHILAFFEKVSELREKNMGKVSDFLKSHLDRNSNALTYVSTQGKRDMIYLGNHRALTKTIFGHKILVDTRDCSLAPHLLLDGYWEMWITKVFLSSLCEGMTVVDIGANVGYYTQLAASKVGSTGKVYAFEANPYLMDLLYQNMSINGFLPWVSLTGKAVLNGSGKVRFNICKTCMGDSSIAGFSQEMLDLCRDDVEAIDVETVSLDEFFGEAGAKIDVIKIDAEGSEPFIFDGMKNILSSNPDIIIISEFSSCHIRGVGRDPDQYLRDIEKAGFKLRIIDESANVVDVNDDDIMNLPNCMLYLKR